jgi:hypothetical protein
MMGEPRRKYMSYLLCLWQVRHREGVAWLASLENARTGERRGFASLDELFHFLRQRTDALCGRNNDSRK